MLILGKPLTEHPPALYPKIIAPLHTQKRYIRTSILIYLTDIKSFQIKAYLKRI